MSDVLQMEDWVLEEAQYVLEHAPQQYEDLQDLDKVEIGKMLGFREIILRDLNLNQL